MLGPEEITVKELARRENWTSIHEMRSDLVTSAVVPALCEDGCRVEPDGECPHGHPAVTKHVLVA